MKKDMTSLKHALRKNTICIIVSFAVSIILFAISSIVGGGEILILLSIIGFVAGILFIGEIGRIKRNHCKVCGTKFKYDTDVSWEETSTEQNIKQPQNSNPESVYATVESYVEITCTCSNCGNERVFNKK